MAVVRKVDKKVRSSRIKVIKYQILTYCFFKNIKVTNTELELLTELSVNNGMEINDLCEQLSVKCIYRTKQSARNAISKVEKKTLIFKDGDARKKKIWISEEMNIETDGSILLDMKVLGV
jgi:DNA-binding MarR family transcriptional regulator